MKWLSSLPYCALLLLNLKAGGSANDEVHRLPPFTVRAIPPPIIKIAEHPVLEPRFGAAAVCDGEYLYVIGGSNDAGARLDSVERIDLRTGRSTSWARLRLPRRHHRAVILDGKIYVLGGTSGLGGFDPLSDELSDYYGRDPDPTYVEPNPKKDPLFYKPPTFMHEASMEVIDLATGRVTSGPPMPVPKALFGCVVIDGRIHVIGGQKRRGDHIFCTNTVEVFDPATNKWSAGINMPTPRRCATVLVEGFVVALGGYDGSARLRTVEVYNPREKVWRRLPDLAEPVNPNSLVWHGRYLFLFGDQETGSRQHVYNLQEKRLEPYLLPLPDSDFAVAVMHEGKIYVVGGASVRREVASAGIQIFEPVPESKPAG